MVDELCRFDTISHCITSRITAVPCHCKHPGIPTLSMESVCDIFYGIYGDCERSDIVNDLLHRLDFRALSITLLATTASYNGWDHDRVAKEWNAHRARVLRTDYNESLAATIEPSLASPTFRKLGLTSSELSPFSHKAETRKTSIGFFPPSPTERTSSTNSVFFFGLQKQRLYHSTDATPGPSQST